MGNYIGIDFGMQNLKVCYYDGRRNIRVDLEGNQSNSGKVSRNAVYYAENEEKTLLNRFFFGAQQAEEARIYGYSDYIRYIKRELQKENYMRSVCDGKYTFSALQIITDIFRQIFFKMRESRYDTAAAVILTVPVIFSETQKEMLKFCAEKAGFHVDKIITEPFAALFSEEIFEECTEDVDDEEYVLMFDFGASTLDICLMRIENQDDELCIETVSSTGLSFGGKDITDLIAEYMTESLNDVIRNEILAGRISEDTQKAEIFEFAEEMKNKLYEEEDTPEYEDRFFGKKIVLKRTNVDKVLDNSKIWDRIFKAISDMFEATDEFDADDFSVVGKVVMTGGTSKIQYFRDKMADLFDSAELVGDLEEEDTIYCSVSSGAVNYARQENISVKNSSPMFIGIETGNGFERALNRNSFYNIFGKRKQVSLNWLKSNDWKIKVYQTLENVKEHTNVAENDILYSGFIPLNKHLYTDDVVIQLKFTEHGITATTASSSEVKNIIEDNILLRSEVRYE